MKYAHSLSCIAVTLHRHHLIAEMCVNNINAHIRLCILRSNMSQFQCRSDDPVHFHLGRRNLISRYHGFIWVADHVKRQCNQQPFVDGTIWNWAILMRDISTITINNIFSLRVHYGHSMSCVCDNAESMFHHYHFYIHASVACAASECNVVSVCVWEQMGLIPSESMLSKYCFGWNMPWRNMYIFTTYTNYFISIVAFCWLHDARLRCLLARCMC